MIAHLTTAHPRTDVRIRVKEAATLAEKLSCTVSLLVQDGLENEQDPSSNLQIIDTGPRAHSRLTRMAFGPWRMFRAVRKLRPKLVHFHDPELIPMALVLRLLGTRVIYDVHEDLPRQIEAKHWIPRPIKKGISWLAEALEFIAGKSFDGFVLAGPSLSPRFPKDRSVIVYNYPILDEFIPEHPIPYAQRAEQFAYVGGITPARGSLEMIRSVNLLQGPATQLAIGGPFQPAIHQQECSKEAGWKRVDYLGTLNRSEIRALLGSSRAGLVTLHPTNSYLNSYPVKMYEYMAASLPIIASDFPLWRDILGGADCALFVDPLDTQSISDAMQWILNNPERAQEMGKVGHYLAIKKYNWAVEAAKLVAFYQEIAPDLVREEERV